MPSKACKEIPSLVSQSTTQVVFQSKIESSGNKLWYALCKEIQKLTGDLPLMITANFLSHGDTFLHREIW